MATLAARRDTRAAGADPQPAAAAGIGPNAVTRLGAAIDRNLGASRTRAIFIAAELEHYLSAPPTTLVDERQVMRLHAIAREKLGDTAYRLCAELAGSLTGDYLLAHRIPRPVRLLLPRLPQALARAMLTRAIERNAWTFVGSGRFYARRTRARTELVIENSPLARSLAPSPGACAYYASTFERLYRELVDRDIEIRERCCLAGGASDCRFDIVSARSENGLPPRVQGSA